MKSLRRLLVVAVLTTAAAIAIPAALAVTPANGEDVILPSGDVYQLGDDGAYHLIPDVATANAMVLRWDALEIVEGVPGDVGMPLASVNATATTSTTSGLKPLAQANGEDVILPSGDVYQFGDDGSYHLIPDVATANAMGLDWNDLDEVDSVPGDVGDAYPSVA
jgi:hypothetical protein